MNSDANIVGYLFIGAEHKPRWFRCVFLPV